MEEKDVKKMWNDLRDCRNELCLLCGKYKEERCKDCRWRSGGEWSKH